ncbi:hypothetical protein ACFORO_41825 [Amycolatopsis halotolerans]|uniref:Uncharacterized protein n=1 Tax=Amycolatopsis halotolerans TaxID=330083 RepID=A0ABV7QX22_9PSEU
MSIGPSEVAAIAGAVGLALSRVARHYFRWKTAKAFVEKAKPEDIAKIAEAMHPEIPIRASRRRRTPPAASRGTEESSG